AVAVWFNQAFRKNQFSPDHLIWLYAKYEPYLTSRRLIVRECGRGRVPPSSLIPHYIVPSALSQLQYLQVVRQGIATLRQSDAFDPWPEELLTKWNLLPLGEALAQLHEPSNAAQLEAARQRLSFDQTVCERASGLLQRNSHPGTPLRGTAVLEAAWRDALPYTLTTDQERCIQEILREMAGTVAMRRLLQGEVGSGKTVVAVAACLRTIASGKQAALLAPTEVLARQHYQTLSKMLPAWCPVHLIVGGSSYDADDMAATQTPGLWVGTHALLQEKRNLPQLALLVVDEQHRFGVSQREQLLQGRQPTPHLLCLSATPIPRSLALTLYGDLSLSTLAQLPSGRKPVRTIWLQQPERLEAFFSFCHQEFSNGHKLYWVCPAIDADPELGLATVQERAPVLNHIWQDYQVLILHGKQPDNERQRVLQEFLYGAGEILLGTTVVEVGLDQPLATVMVIENAPRFGLAQLHQLRGRVGRSHRSSYCVLLGGTLEQLQQGEEPILGEAAVARLRALCDSNDGFELARLDLELRGPGEVFGIAQSGFTASFALSWPLGDVHREYIEEYLGILTPEELAKYRALLSYTNFNQGGA
ncbi:MAG: DEAD/DEAH box helicase, partial [Symbiobacteriaceae bacterium]|nr:DEAD/DEAH box helicase [Symbiobacteriaceae bacterium]